MVTYTVNAPEGQAPGEGFELTLYLPHPPQWLYLDREPLSRDAVRLEPQSLVRLRLPFGHHQLQLGWEGTGQLPPEGAEIPVLRDGQQVAGLTARFSLQGMQASGGLPLQPGMATLVLRLAQPLPAGEVTVVCGSQTIARWQTRGTDLVGPEPLLIPPQATLALRVDHYALAEVPVSAVIIESYHPASPVAQVDDAVPDGAVLVEAEAFADAGGPAVKVDPGSHYDEHGGASVYNFTGDGAWLQWTLNVPQTGRYDLYARISCGSERAFRAITVDGASPPGLGLVEFPGTGGWGHGPGEWQLVRLTGFAGGPPSLQLIAGPHTIRFTGVLQLHLNLDYLFLLPAP